MSGIQCPHCGQPISDEEAVLCLFCGESLGRQVTLLDRMKRGPVYILLLAGVVILIVSFLIRL